MKARKVRNTPSRSVATVSRQSARDISCSGVVGPAIPALATTTRTGPSCPARPASAATEASSRTSQPNGIAVPPALSASATVSAKLEGSRALAATVYPAAARGTVMARPIPLLAPVTPATGAGGERSPPMPSAPQRGEDPLRRHRQLGQPDPERDDRVVDRGVDGGGRHHPAALGPSLDVVGRVRRRGLHAADGG